MSGGEKIIRGLEEALEYAKSTNDRVNAMVPDKENDSRWSLCSERSVRSPCQRGWEMSDDTHSLEGPQCPYCGRQYTADEPIYFAVRDYTRETCDECGKTFAVEVCIETSWLCEPIAGQDGSLIAPEPAEQKLSTESLKNTRSPEGEHFSAEEMEMMNDALAQLRQGGEKNKRRANLLELAITRARFPALPQTAALSSSGGEALTDSRRAMQATLRQFNTWGDLTTTHTLMLREAIDKIDAALSNGASVIEKQMGPTDVPRSPPENAR